MKELKYTQSAVKFQDRSTSISCSELQTSSLQPYWGFMTEIQMMKNTAFQMVMLTEPAGGTQVTFASFMYFKMQNISSNDNLKRQEVFWLI